MYQYEPHLPKKGETLLFFGCVTAAAILLGISNLAGTPYPAIWQVLTVCFVICAILLLIQYLSTRYSYAIVQRAGADGEEEEKAELELVITRFFGKRATVVCRIPLTDIFEAMPVNRHNRRERRELTRGRNYYRFTACLFADGQTLLAVRENERMAYVHMLADEKLLSLLRDF